MVRGRRHSSTDEDRISPAASVTEGRRPESGRQRMTMGLTTLAAHHDGDYRLGLPVPRLSFQRLTTSLAVDLAIRARTRIGGKDLRGVIPAVERHVVSFMVK